MKNNLIGKNRIFFNRIAKYYDFSIFKKWQENVKNTAFEMTYLKDHTKILDAGCGTGSLLGMLNKINKTLQLYGIDISPVMLKIAKKKLIKANFKLSSVEKINEKEFYDYIFSTDAFHHYENQDLAMRNFYRALKKEGRLVIIDFDFGIFNHIFHKIEPGNNKMNSSLEFMNLFKKYGFKEIKQKRVGLFNVITIGKKEM
jgi:ubiquinone/menaquinone biosynthesis C-methylase UbiE